MCDRNKDDTKTLQEFYDKFLQPMVLIQMQDSITLPLKTVNDAFKVALAFAGSLEHGLEGASHSPHKVVPHGLTELQEAMLDEGIASLGFDSLRTKVDFAKRLLRWAVACQDLVAADFQVITIALSKSMLVFANVHAGLCDWHASHKERLEDISGPGHHLFEAVAEWANFGPRVLCWGDDACSFIRKTLVGLSRM